MKKLMETNLENLSALRCIKALSDKLKDQKLANVASAAPLINGLMKKLPLASQEQVLAFVAVFDRQCAGRNSDIDDIANYFDCSALEALELVPALKELVAKGLLRDDDGSRRLSRQQFGVEDEVLEAIAAGRPVSISKRKAAKFTQYDLCNFVSGLVSDSDVKTASLLSRTEEAERCHGSLELVKRLKDRRLKLSTADRVLFYEMCHDFLEDEEDATSIRSTLRDLYDKVVDRTKAKKLLVSGEHPLMRAELIEQTGEFELSLTDEGKCLLFGADAAFYGVSSDKLDRYAFAEKMEKIVKGTSKDVKNHSETLVKKVKKLEAANGQLGFIGKLVDFDPQARLVFYLAAKAAINGGAFTLDHLEEIYDRQDCFVARNLFKQERHPLIAQELVETATAGFFDQAALALTDKGKDLYFEEDAHLFVDTATAKELVAHDKIAEKRLFFEPGLERQLRLVGDSLREDSYLALRNRLKEKHLPEGIAILLYGEPGTGKTESVMQMARETSRDVMHVDISQTKSCWFGESEKIIKGIFRKYRRLCKRCKRTPILLFNEADAVFSKRKDSASGNVAQTENAIQNIILEEMESLDGILVATTNLAGNLDKAFERRFLFKVRFGRPTAAAKQCIWRDKLPWLSDEQAAALAREYDFSGGEIDNIVRKAAMKELLEGGVPTLDAIAQFCREERLGGLPERKIGFA